MTLRYSGEYVNPCTHSKNKPKKVCSKFFIFLQLKRIQESLSEKTDCFNLNDVIFKEKGIILGKLLFMFFWDFIYVQNASPAPQEQLKRVETAPLCTSYLLAPE